MKTNENFKQVLMSLFDEKDIDPEYREKVRVDAILEEFHNDMKKFYTEMNELEAQKRKEVIQTLTKDELQLVIDLYMQDLIAMYEKQTNAKIDCYVK